MKPLTLISEQVPTAEPLAAFLSAARKASRLSLAQIAERTKVQTRFLEALETGDIAALPSPAHMRAFTLAYARACGADEAQGLVLLAQALGKSAAPSLPRDDGTPLVVPKLSSVAKPQTLEREKPLNAVPNPIQPGASAAGPKPLPRWGLVLAMSVAVGLTLLGLRFAIESTRRWRETVTQAVQKPVALAQTQANPIAKDTPQDIAPAAAISIDNELVLRARRPSWLVLEIDGQRLPTVMLEESEKRRWPVKQRAVLLAGNIGALRVWWGGQNLGYLGELGQRSNGLVFEVNQAWRKDPTVKLALPAGVPE